MHHHHALVAWQPTRPLSARIRSHPLTRVATALTFLALGAGLLGWR